MQSNNKFISLRIANKEKRTSYNIFFNNENYDRVTYISKCTLLRNGSTDNLQDNINEEEISIIKLMVSPELKEFKNKLIEDNKKLRKFIDSYKNSIKALNFVLYELMGFDFMEY